MTVNLVSPMPDDAGFWLKVRSQKSTQDNNPIGILSEEKLRSQIVESNSEISERKSTHRYYIQTDDQNFAGVISLKDINWESGVCEIGYLIAEEYQGQGIASQSVRLILQRAFDSGIKKIKATTSAKNTASYRVLQKNGFTLEGYLKNEFLVKGQPHDVYLWAADQKSFEGAIVTNSENGIRPARITDVEAIHKLSHELGYSPTIEEIEGNLAKILIHPDYEVVVIEKGSGVVGWMTIYKRLRVEDVEFLQVAAVVTDERFRSQGLGQTLMSYAEKKARSLNLPFVGLHSSKRRDLAHKFYERIGYAKSKESYFFRKDI